MTLSSDYSLSVPRRWRTARGLFGAFLVLLCAGCSARIGGSQGVEKVLENLRAENARLRQQLTDSQGKLAEAGVKLSALASGTVAGPTGPTGPTLSSIPTETLALLPMITTVEIDAKSSLRESATGDAWIEVLVVSLDGRRRFVQAVGTIRARAELAAPSPEGTMNTGLLPVNASDTDQSSVALGGDARPVYETVIRDQDLREAYRSGFMGTHYVINVPIPKKSGTPGSPSGSGTKPTTSKSEHNNAHVSVTFTDRLTGRVLTAARTIVMTPVPPRSSVPARTNGERRNAPVSAANDRR